MTFSLAFDLLHLLHYSYEYYFDIVFHKLVRYSMGDLGLEIRHL